MMFRLRQILQKKRQIAQVFQFPVVYDTMTVFDNLAFPLRNRGLDEETINQRVIEIADNDWTGSNVTTTCFWINC